MKNAMNIILGCLIAPLTLAPNGLQAQSDDLTTMRRQLEEQRKLIQQQQQQINQQSQALDQMEQRLNEMSGKPTVSSSADTNLTHFAKVEVAEPAPRAGEAVTCATT